MQFKRCLKYKEAILYIYMGIPIFYDRTIAPVFDLAMELHKKTKTRNLTLSNY